VLGAGDQKRTKGKGVGKAGKKKKEVMQKGDSRKNYDNPSLGGEKSEEGGVGVRYKVKDSPK